VDGYARFGIDWVRKTSQLIDVFQSFSEINTAIFHAGCFGHICFIIQIDFFGTQQPMLAQLTKTDQ
jgi:hypothetical protein